MIITLIDMDDCLCNSNTDLKGLLRFLVITFGFQNSIMVKLLLLLMIYKKFD